MCLSVYLSTSTFLELHIESSRNFWCMLPNSMTRSSSDGFLMLSISSFMDDIMFACNRERKCANTIIKYIFQIKYKEATLSNSTRPLLWFEISKMLIGFKNKFSALFITIFGTFSLALFRWHFFVPCGKQ